MYSTYFSSATPKLTTLSTGSSGTEVNSSPSVYAKLIDANIMKKMNLLIIIK